MATKVTIEFSELAAQTGDLVIKSKGIEEGDKWVHNADAVIIQSKYGPILMNPLAEEDRGTHDTYMVTNTKDKGPRLPDKLLKVKRAGDEEFTILCGLFLKEHQGEFYLKGKSLDDGTQYGVFNQVQRKKAVANG